MQPITNPRHVEFQSIQDLKFRLHTGGCRACDLGFQENLNGCCVARGNPESKRMIVGEAPGKHEDAQSEPFVGPAGQLLDKILVSVDLNPDQDFYITNVVLCRPIAAKGSGKENFTPRIQQRNRCRPYLEQQIKLIRPRVIVPLGRPATEAILGLKNIKMGDFRGKEFTIPAGEFTPEQIRVFPMLHPAAILHAQPQPEKHQLYREQTWEDVKRLKDILVEEEL